MTEEEAAHLTLDPSVVAVVAGINYSFSYRKICIASLYIRENQAIFVGTNPDRNVGKAPRLVAGGGTCIKAIESSSGTSPIFMGKPFHHIFDQIRQDHSLLD